MHAQTMKLGAYRIFSSFPLALEAHHALPLGALDCKADVDVAVQGVDRAPDPRPAVSIVDLAAQRGLRAGIGPQRVHGRIGDG